MSVVNAASVAVALSIAACVTGIIVNDVHMVQILQHHSPLFCWIFAIVYLVELVAIRSRRRLSIQSYTMTGRAPPLVPPIRQGLICTIASIFCFHIVFVLMGAPVVFNMTKTAALAAMLAALAVGPTALNFGFAQPPHSAATTSTPTNVLDALIYTFFNDSPDITDAKLSFWSACIGAWLGAIPIPLDWDAWWQEWPISVCLAMPATVILAWVARATVIRPKLD
ncbi:hypothetical protein CAOG_03020 [Capsaspora owczarzaki ATCC 30864]|uniref:Uncharacterized protein n=1 Tax=Capsaspora owczarzaki (strain ATCC 30864) TaxID=595528 RepID=A0A0D2VNQ0_CAPO3|nr:hypothetical protein CAOG_03020 [Capsaspora owczarzaki ATCC 30864]KJE91977.1 hypothetical protein CAOG_003020 [Capsaspora owczarzaki ATCC 30864]|eukprot:XP_004363859.1 hypothetical protein CAOG_03020 [Capsaspora owczarzaki ATCC 30864]